MDKNNYLADAVGNLYRGALYLARSDLDKKLGREFIDKAVEKLKKNRKYFQEGKNIERMVKKYQKSNLILAEKILDKYHLLKYRI